MDVFSAVAAGFGLSAQLISLCRKLHSIGKSIRYARGDVGGLADEMRVFGELYQQFLEICVDDQANRKRAPSAVLSSSPIHLIAWTKSAVRELRYLLRSVKPLKSDPRHEYSLTEKLKAHLKWYFSRRNVNHLRASLSVARESITGFTNLWAIKSLKKQLRFLKQAMREGMKPMLETQLGSTVENYIQLLEESIQSRYQMRWDIDERLRLARERLTVAEDKSKGRGFELETSQLLEFTKVVRQYAGSHSSKRTRNAPTSSGLMTESPAKRESSSASHTSFPTKISASRPEFHGTATSDSAAQGTDVTTVPSCSSGQVLTAASSDKYVERYSHNREYINDPNGSILSPPIVRPSRSITPPKSNTGGEKLGSASLQKSEKKANKNGSLTGSGSPSRPSIAKTRCRCLSQPGEVAEPKADGGKGNRQDDGPGPETAVEGKAESGVGPSPFQPLPPFQGKSWPNGWHQRRDRSMSPEDFW